MRRTLPSILSAVFVWLLATSCGGDARANYVGTYSSNVLEVITINGTPNNSSLPGTLIVNELAAANQISLEIDYNSGTCVLTAAVAGNSFSLNPASTQTCSGTATTTGGVTCTTTYTYTSGSGSRTAGSGAIGMSLAGTWAAACQDNTTQSGTVTDDVTTN